MNYARYERPFRIYHGPSEPKKYPFVVYSDEGEPGYDLACLLVSRRLPGGGIAVERCDTEPPARHAKGRAWRAYCDEPAAGILACRNASRGLT